MKSKCCKAKVDKAMRRIGLLEYLCRKCKKHCGIIKSRGKTQADKLGSKKGEIKMDKNKKKKCFSANCSGNLVDNGKFDICEKCRRQFIKSRSPQRLVGS